MSLVHTSGPQRMREGTPGSAFSRGDLLCLNASSQLSKHPLTALIDIVGVAAADSTKSINNKVTYQIPVPGQTFLAEVTAGSALTVGAQVGFGSNAAGNHIVSSTATVLRATIVSDAASVQGQSAQSRVVIEFINHDGNLAFS